MTERSFRLVLLAPIVAGLVGAGAIVNHRRSLDTCETAIPMLLELVEALPGGREGSYDTLLTEPLDSPDPLIAFFDGFDVHRLSAAMDEATLDRLEEAARSIRSDLTRWEPGDSLATTVRATDLTDLAAGVEEIANHCIETGSEEIRVPLGPDEQRRSDP